MNRWLCFLVACGLCLARAPSAAAEPAAQVEPAPQQHAPRVFAVTAAGSYAFRSELPLTQSGRSVRPWGLQGGARFGWQVGGLAGGRASWIGFEMHFAAQPGKDYRDSYALLYGLFAKHALSRHARVRPYFCYGLGAAQVWVRDVGGRGIGHETRVELGIDVRTAERRHVTLALTYQAVIMPSFARDGLPASDTSFHAALLSTGLWFGKTR